MSIKPTQPTKKIPVILDTDIGTDIDDTWALAFLLRCPELDVRLITTATGNTYEKAKIVARLLEIAGRTDIPIGIGLPLEDSPCYQSAWVQDYNLGKYPGRVLENGVQSLIDTINTSSENMVVLGIAPLPNLAAALMYDPSIVHRSRFIGMFGSIHKGYFGKDEIVAEYNIKLYPYACRMVFSSDWDKTIAPLDTSGILQLKGEKYKRIRNCHDILVQAIMENYDCWTKYNQNPLYHGFDPETESSILYDLLPVYMAFSEALLNIEEHGIAVSEDGYTKINEDAKKIRCALSWRDVNTFEDFVVSRLTGQ